jgi:primosomal replication protein N
MNQVVLDAQLTERGAMRYTPAGLPALDLKAVVIGGLAERLSRVELGSAHRFSGFLASQRNGRGVVLHVTELP